VEEVEHLNLLLEQVSLEDQVVELDLKVFLLEIVVILEVLVILPQQVLLKEMLEVKEVLGQTVEELLEVVEEQVQQVLQE
jgi:hypothetical protein